VRTLRPPPRIAGLLVGVSTLVVAPVSAGEVLLRPLAQWRWGTAISPDLAPMLLVAAVLLIAAVVAVVLARRRWPRPSEKDRATSASLDEFAIAHWVEDGQRFLKLWQERIEHLGELHDRLAAMTQEINQLRAQVSRIEELRAESLRLSQEGEALLLERDQLWSILARIGQLIQRASEARPGPVGGAAPEVGS